MYTQVHGSDVIVLLANGIVTGGVRVGVGSADAGVSEGCSNKHSSREQETKHSTVERTTAKAEEDSRANITHGYITGTSETTIIASTTAHITDKRKR